MSTAENASASEDAVSMETSSEMPHGKNQSGPIVAPNGNTPNLTENFRLKDRPQSSEDTYPDNEVQNSVSSIYRGPRNGSHVVDTTEKIGNLSLTNATEEQRTHGISKVLLSPSASGPEDGNGVQRPPHNTSHIPKLLSSQPSEPPDSKEKGIHDVPSSTETKSNFQGPDLVPDAGIADKDSQPEIQSIMDQFAGETEALGKDEIMSPRLDMAKFVAGSSGGFPPRRSSLEPVCSSSSGPTGDTEKDLPNPPVPPKTVDSPLASPTRSNNVVSSVTRSGPPPLPEPEPDLPFDFHRFLEQLRHKSADPVAKFLRSFLNEFGKKQWMVHEQVKIIGDFLTFIANKMALCDVWREVSDAEFDNAKEGMEKLVMNRLYAQTFSPAILPQPLPSRGKIRRRDVDKLRGQGRRGQHQEDVERDDILAQKFKIYAWVKEEHLDIPSVGPKGTRFLQLAQQELLKIKGYRAPRDKVICVLNCCKVIVGLLKSSKSADTSADSFVPLLIYVVLQAHPEHLVSNIQYILRFRNQEKLGGEAGYYLSSLSGAIQFIEDLDRTSLTVSDEDFERHVELAVSAIAEKNREAEKRSLGHMVSEKSTISEPEVTPRTSMDANRSSPGKVTSRPILEGTDGGSDDHDAVAGLLRTIQRPLSSIGRIFSDEPNATQRRGSPASSLPPGPTPRLSPLLFQPPRKSAEQGRSDEPSQEKSEHPGDVMLDAQEAAARQASAEAAEARRIQGTEHHNVVETLYSMFPNLDRDVIDDVVRLKEGRAGRAVDACLALSAGG